MGIITFLSDFGDKDWFVSAVKGEILKINPEVQIINITHNLNPFDISQGAFVLKMFYKNFPKGTVHLVVVDPGVGSERKPIIVESDGYYYVGPDNGIFSYIYSTSSKVYEIDIKKKNISSTFHARDIFGPVAAYLSKGERPSCLGHLIKKYIKFGFPKIKIKKNKIFGEIVYVDHFGNLITNIPVKIPVRKIYLGNSQTAEVKEFYQKANFGKVVGVRGSSGYYEIAFYKAQADQTLNLGIGDKIIAET